MSRNTYLLCAWRCVRRAASVLCGQPPCWQWWRNQWWARLMTLYAQHVPVLARSYALRIPLALSSYPPDVHSQGHRCTCWHLEGKEETLSLFMVFTFILTVNIFPLHRHTHPSIYHIGNVTVPENTVVAKSSGNGTKVFWYTLQLAAFEWLNLCDCSSVYHRNMSIIISLKTKAAWSEWKTLCQCQNFLYNSLYKPQLSERWSEL